ncbi:NAD-dependent epimerase/dehydratase family protein [Micromonospora sp. NPDC050980]|uniref:NAD-dependent epimerase/dehydratase family protein n=1 Tax=Micromonospora sp. NPDC050980 TaxID=3155161 RepID=UPI003408CE94
MRVLVTGGTGFLGAHTVAALLGDGHEVRMLVRHPDRVPGALTPLGVDPGAVELAVGDVTDRADVRRAVDGCAGVLHAAGVYSFDPRRRAEMRNVNVTGAEVVLDAARAAGADPVVHVSTFGALLPTTDRTVGPQTAVGTPREAYLAGKAAAETIARAHQADGAPVVITYPLATLGPHDPQVGDQLRRVRDVLRGLTPLWPTGGFPIGDVRDVAHLHRAVFTPGLGPRRYLAPGRYVTTREYLDALRRVTGRRLPALHLPAAALLPVAALADLAQRALPFPLPVQYGAVYLCRAGTPVRTAETTELLGGAPRPLDETMGDAVRWLHRAGLIGRAAAGRAASDPAGATASTG